MEKIISLDSIIANKKPFYFMYNGQRYNAAFYGNQTMFKYEEIEPEPPLADNYLWFQGLDETNGVTVNVVTSTSYGYYYSYDKTNWTYIANGTLNVEQGQKIYFKGIHNGRQRPFGTYGRFNIGGNINTLLSSPEYQEGTLPPDSNQLFMGLFQNTNIVDASQLILPATTLTTSCYRQMFNGCSLLTTAPALPATTLAIYCYNGMFKGCTALTAAPALPATTLAGYCYYEMFYGCTTLTTAPALPATTMYQSCYRDMFRECGNITTAPDLPAATLAANCYEQIFMGCFKINYIKCLATDISATSCTKNWVANDFASSVGVAFYGTFVCAAGMENTWTIGRDGIPYPSSQWTVQTI